MSKSTVTRRTFTTIAAGSGVLPEAEPDTTTAAAAQFLLIARRVTADVMILQAGWLNPVMNPDGKISETQVNDMIVTFVLLREGQTWKASEIDPHNIEKMELPFSNPGQKS